MSDELPEPNWTEYSVITDTDENLWPVNDNPAFHPTVIEAGNAAIGLWARADASAKARFTAGFIPARVAYQLGTRQQCNRLVTAGLFQETEDGYRIRDLPTLSNSCPTIQSNSADGDRQ